MGFLVNGKCAHSIEAALSSSCAQFPVSAVESGELVTYSCTGTSTAPQQLNLLRVATPSGTSASAVQAVSYGACDSLADYADTSQAWLLMVGVVAVLALARWMYSHLLGNH